MPHDEAERRPQRRGAVERETSGAVSAPSPEPRPAPFTGGVGGAGGAGGGGGRRGPRVAAAERVPSAAARARRVRLLPRDAGLAHGEALELALERRRRGPQLRGLRGAGAAAGRRRRGRRGVAWKRLEAREQRDGAAAD